MTLDKRQIFLQIHKALQTEQNLIIINGIPYPILRNGLPSVLWDNKLFVFQTQNSNTLYGRLTESGHPVTYIKRTGEKWGYIIDNIIVDPLGEA